MTFTKALDSNSSKNNFGDIKKWMATILELEHSGNIEVDIAITTSTASPVTFLGIPRRNQIHLPDLEKAVEYSLLTEIPTNQWIMRDSALHWLHSLLLYAPLRLELKSFIYDLRANLTSREVGGFSSSEWSNLTQELMTDDTFVFTDWVGCKGSQPHYRGKFDFCCFIIST